MRFRIEVLVFCSVALVFAGAAGRGEPLGSAAVHAEPQYYLLALPTAPVSEIAAQVLGEALGLPFQVDEDVDAEMGFRAEGLFAPKALAREFGDRLRDVDVTLIDRPSEGLWLIPTGELSAAISEGALVVTTEGAVPTVARGSLPPVVTERIAERGPSPASNWPGWLAMAAIAVAAGWSGCLALAGTGRGRRAAIPVLPPAPNPPSDDLVVPHFEQIDSPASIPIGESCVDTSGR